MHYVGAATPSGRHGGDGVIAGFPRIVTGNGHLSGSHVRTLEHGGWSFLQRESLYLERTDRACRAPGDVAAMPVSDGTAAWRWWTLEELDTTAEAVRPAGLAGLIACVLGPPLDRAARLLPHMTSFIRNAWAGRKAANGLGR